jgi:hypothetical protein
MHARERGPLNSKDINLHASEMSVLEKTYTHLGGITEGQRV